jgi:hypothetical protein
MLSGRSRPRLCTRQLSGERPTGIASGRTEVRAVAVILLRARSRLHRPKRMLQAHATEGTIQASWRRENRGWRHPRVMVVRARCVSTIARPTKSEPRPTVSLARLSPTYEPPMRIRLTHLSFRRSFLWIGAAWSAVNGVPLLQLRARNLHGEPF